MKKELILMMFETTIWKPTILFYLKDFNSVTLHRDYIHPKSHKLLKQQ